MNQEKEFELAIRIATCAVAVTRGVVTEPDACQWLKMEPALFRDAVEKLTQLAIKGIRSGKEEK